MAAGRGEFFRSFLEGLEKKPEQPAPARGQPGPGRGKPGPGAQQPGPGGGKTGDRRWQRRPKAAPSSVSSWPERGTEKNKAYFPKMNLMERLPSEILIKILSYLDASSLSCIGHVSKLFHHLANDDVMWHKIYMSEFGSQTWKPKLADDAEPKGDPVEGGDRSTGHWKKMYFRMMAGQEINKWRRELREISLYTGLPRQTEWVLRNLNVSWELTVCDCWGRENTLVQSRAYFFESSVIVRWSGGSFPEYQYISNIQLHGVRKETLKSPGVRKPGWRSLILKLDMKCQRGRFLGKDRLIKLIHLSPGFIVGVWRGLSAVAFIMVSLHFHRLVEKSLLGSPVCPYSEPVDLPRVDNSDSEFGLHGYTLHFVLHNTGTEIMSGHFRQLSCCRVQIQRGLLELKVINRTNLSQHRSLSGNIKMPWKSEALEGSVESCCIITLTLLDEFQKPFWCVSSPIRAKNAKKKLTFDYSGEHFLMEYLSAEGQVKMKLVWLKEQKQFFLISLAVYIPVYKVNKHFSRKY
ncbi:F-box only protein 15-like isoform X1 [Dicentrarchus labrax]|uniref:F-box domain-containing protein n=1 Tax=Dicentrarchus labrax TaxID=13489 RepID=A0A8P4G5P2_DICLA|nr:F-box only protein 15-like isoform X1 [Dicentrarchus labrax]